MKNKTMAIAGMILISSLAVKASPRTDFLREKLRSAYTVEVQLKAKHEATERAYRASKVRTDELERELKRVMKRERAEDEAAREAKIAAYKHVNEYMSSDLTSPTAIRWNVK